MPTVFFFNSFYNIKFINCLKNFLRAGTFGALLEYGAEKQVSKQSAVAASVVVGVPTGVTLKLKQVLNSVKKKIYDHDLEID